MRQFVAFALKAAISAALLYVAIGRTDFGMIGERLNRIDVMWVLAAIAVAALQLVLVSLRWKRIARHCGAALTFPTSFRFNLIATFFNQVLPSTVGGDAVRIWLFARDGAGWSKATYSVLLDRFIGVLSLALLVVAGLPWALELISNLVGRMALLVIGFGSIGAAVAFVAMGCLRWAWLDRWWPIRHLMQMAATARSLLAAPAAAATVIGLSLVIHVFTGAVAWCAARAVAAPFEFMHALLLVPPVLLIATIPISIAGWGVRESTLMLAFAYAGLPESDGLIVSMLLGGSALMVGLAGGAVWLITGEPRQLSAAWRPEQPPPAA
jgi:uncharacterized membrane protein YbhN (UPF0104 family)